MQVPHVKGDEIQARHDDVMHDQDEKVHVMGVFVHEMHAHDVICLVLPSVRIISPLLLQVTEKDESCWMTSGN